MRSFLFGLCLILPGAAQSQECEYSLETFTGGFEAWVERVWEVKLETRQYEPETLIMPFQSGATRIFTADANFETEQQRIRIQMQSIEGKLTLTEIRTCHTGDEAQE